MITMTHLRNLIYSLQAGRAGRAWQALGGDGGDGGLAKGWRTPVGCRCGFYGRVCMRKIGYLESEPAARSFGDFLLVKGIDNQVEAESPSQWAVWVHDEDHLTEAEECLARFRKDPQAAEFKNAAPEAARLRAQRQADKEAFEKRLHGREELRSSLAGYRPGMVSIFLILLCVCVYIALRLERNEAELLFITQHASKPGFWSRLMALEEIRRGELWRLVTPALMHFSILHILFNMMWLFDLGSMIETRQGSGYFLLKFVLIAAVSNFCQYMVGGLMFGGMSGVVYGLLGYVWIRGKYDLTSGYYLHHTTVVSMLIWFFACYTGWLGHVANTAHASGLVMGMAWGWIAARRR